MERMRRTQIYLEPELAEALDRVAQRRGTSRAGLIREAARDLVARENPEDDPIFGIIGMASGGPSDVSERHDDYLIDEVMASWKRS